MTPVAPGVVATKSATASTLGSIEPLPNWPEAMYSRASLDGDRVQSHFSPGAEADGHPRHAGRNHQQLGAQVVSEQAGGNVLVHHGFDADDGPVGVDLDRDATAAHRDDDRPVVEQTDESVRSRESRSAAAK